MVHSVIAQKVISVAVVCKENTLHLEVEERGIEARHRFRVLHPCPGRECAEDPVAFHVRTARGAFRHDAEIRLTDTCRERNGSTLYNSLAADGKSSPRRAFERSCKIFAADIRFVVKGYGAEHAHNVILAHGKQDRGTRRHH